MEFKFYCQQCGQHIAATTEQIGHRWICPTCSHPFDVPAPDGYQPQRKQPPPPPPRATVDPQNPADSTVSPPPPQKQQSKNPFGFVGTILVILVIWGIRSCVGGGSDANRITKVLTRCVEISHRAARYNGNPGGQANFIATEFQKIDVSNCPPDFRTAFQAHIFAWQEAAPALANDTLGNNFLEGMLAGATNDSRFIGQAGGQAAMATQQINATYYEVTQVAARYGARIPNSTVEN